MAGGQAEGGGLGFLESSLPVLGRAVILLGVGVGHFFPAVRWEMTKGWFLEVKGQAVS